MKRQHRIVFLMTLNPAFIVEYRSSRKAEWERSDYYRYSNLKEAEAAAHSNAEDYVVENLGWLP